MRKARKNALKSEFEWKFPFFLKTYYVSLFQWIFSRWTQIRRQLSHFFKIMTKTKKTAQKTRIFLFFVLLDFNSKLEMSYLLKFMRKIKKNCTKNQNLSENFHFFLNTTQVYFNVFLLDKSKVGIRTIRLAQI